MHTSVYSNSHGATSWNGVQLVNGSEFDAFMEGEVASRLHDKAGKADFTSHLNSLASTGFAQDSLQAILEAEHPEKRDWAVGEPWPRPGLAANMAWSGHGIWNAINAHLVQVSLVLIWSGL